MKCSDMKSILSPLSSLSPSGHEIILFSINIQLFIQIYIREKAYSVVCILSYRIFVIFPKLSFMLILLF